MPHTLDMLDRYLPDQVNYRSDNDLWDFFLNIDYRLSQNRFNAFITMYKACSNVCFDPSVCSVQITVTIQCAITGSCIRVVSLLHNFCLSACSLFFYSFSFAHSYILFLPLSLLHWVKSTIWMLFCMCTPWIWKKSQKWLRTKLIFLKG